MLRLTYVSREMNVKFNLKEMQHLDDKMQRSF